MKLWLLTKRKNIDYYESCKVVIAAETEELAKHVYKDWNDSQKIAVAYLGEARDGMPAGVVCSD